MTTLNLDIGTEVYCKREHCGSLRKVVMDQEDERITDLIVERGFLDKTSRVVPVALVVKTDESGVHLAIDSEDLESYPEYEVLEIQKPRVGRGNVSAYREKENWVWYDSYGFHVEEPLVPKVQVELENSIRAKSATIERETEVRNLSQTFGRVDHVLTNAETQELTHLIVRRGVIPTFYVVPATVIQEVGEESIILDMSEEAFEDLPRYHPRDDEEIEQDIRAKLAEHEDAFDDVALAVDHGLVSLTGTVVDLRAKRRVEALAASTEGVVDVKNDVNADASVSLRVMSALLEDPVTRLALLDVTAHQGTVTLEGRVDSEGIKAAAAAIASRQRGVQDVRNALDVKPNQDGDRLRAPQQAPYKLRDNA
jgi:osmotically-inducible protein OsmY